MSFTARALTHFNAHWWMMMMKTFHLFMRNTLTKYDKLSKVIWYFVIEWKFQLWAYAVVVHHIVEQSVVK